MSRIKITTSHNCTLAGIMLPMNTVYGIFPPTVRNGKVCAKMYAWIKNPELARKNRHFTVCVLRGEDKYVHTWYVDGAFGFAKELKDALMSANIVGKVSEFMSKKDYSSILPHDRTIGQYNQRPRPGKEDSPYLNTRITTEVSVTAGCKVGKNFYTEEGYLSKRMGIHADNYGEIGKNSLDMMRELAKLSSKCKDKLPDVFGE